MFLVMNPPLKHRKGKKSKRARSTRKNSGGGKSRLAKLLAKFRAHSAKRTSFRGTALNRGGSGRPLTCRLSSAPFTGVNMKRHGGRGRRVRRNAGTLSAVKSSVMSGLSPKVWLEVLPYAGGAVSTELATQLLSKWIPMTKGGIGNIVLGAAMSGVTGFSTGALMGNKAVGSKMFIGGVAGVIGKIVKSVSTMGFGGTFGLHGMDGSFPEMFHGSFMGMNDFISPAMISNAVQSGAQVAQFSLPNANAQYAPMAPQMQAAGAPSMADYEGNAVGAMLDQGSGY